MKHSSYPFSVFIAFLKEKQFEINPYSPQFMIAEKAGIGAPIACFEDSISSSNIKVVLDRLEIDEDYFLVYVCEK